MSHGSLSACYGLRPEMTPLMNEQAGSLSELTKSLNSATWLPCGMMKPPLIHALYYLARELREHHSAINFDTHIQ